MFLTKKFISQYTDVGQIGLPTLAGIYALKKKDYEGATYLIFSAIVNQVAVEVLKRVFNARRPNGGKHSFPSGHTSAAFLGPFFLMARYRFSIINPLVCSSMLAALLVGVGRVAIRAHWPRDIVAGAALAYGVIWLSLPASERR